MGRPHELGFEECVQRLVSEHRGRVAVATPDGPHILPVTYSWVDHEVVIRTSPYSVLGTYGRGTVVAFEVSGRDDEDGTGWSVVLRGRAEPVVSLDGADRAATGWPARHDAEGPGSLLVRIRMSELGGRRLEADQTAHP